jgi:uncharacterized protein (DUF305 family)
MKNALKILTLAALVASLGTTAIAQPASGSGPGMDMPAMQKMMQEMMPKEADPASTKALKEVHLKMMHSAPMFTGNPDIDFVRQMIPHHQGAIDAAKVQLAYGKDAKMRALAKKIIKDQQKEIAEMEAWLKKNAK